MYLKKQLLGVLIFLCSSYSLFANHTIGAELSYKHISGSKYEFSLTVFAECSSSANFDFTGYPLKIKSNCGIIFLTLTSEGISNWTPIPYKCSDSSLCDGGIPYGCKKQVLKGVATLPSGCCEFSVLWEGICCRTYYTTSVQLKGIKFAIQTKLNSCYQESSPVFVTSNDFYLRTNEVQHKSFLANDSSKNGFITYEIVEPIEDSIRVVSFLPGFSYKKPFSIIGNLFTKKDQYPSGFFFDTLTGEVMFKPITQNQISPITIKAKKWKKINDTLRVVSESIKDIAYTIIPAGNHLPSFGSFENEFITCTDTGLHWFTIPVSDADSSDTLYLSYSHSLGNRLIISDSGTHNNKIIKVGYRVDSNSIKNKTIELLTINAADSACPINGVNSKTYKLIVKPYLPDSFAFKPQLNCKSLLVNFTNNSSVKNITTNWSIASIKDTIVSNQSVIPFDLPDSGWYKIHLTVRSDAHCSKRDYYDSIYLSNKAFLAIKAPVDTILCFNPTTVLQPIVTNGTLPLKYKWSTGDTTPTIAVTNNNQSSQYWVSVTDANNCYTQQDTVNIYYFNPKVNITGDKEVCIGNAVQLLAILSDTIAPTFGWTGFNSSTQLTHKPNQNKQYHFMLTDASGCKIDTSWGVVVYSPKIQFTHNVDVCRGDSLTFSAQADSSIAPYTYTWISIGKTGQKATIPTKNLSLGFTNATLEVTDSFGCKTTQNTKAFVKPTPNINFTTIPTMCISMGQLNLNPYSNPQGGVWIGKGVDTSSNTLNLQLADTGLHQLKYIYTSNDFNCTDSGASTIKIDRINTANFIADKVIGKEGDTISFTNTSITKDLSKSKWNFGDPNSGSQNIFTGQSTSHTYQDSGLYTVQLIVTGGACSNDTLTKTSYITITKKSGVGIWVSKVKKNNLKLYPNPANDRLTIEADNILAEIVLVDVLGRLYTIESILGDSKAEINLGALPAGIYILEAKDIEGKMYTAKVQISR